MAVQCVGKNESAGGISRDMEIPDAAATVLLWGFHSVRESPSHDPAPSSGRVSLVPGVPRGRFKVGYRAG